MKDEKVNALMILEIIGKPAQYLVDTMNNVINQLAVEPGVAVRNRNVREPRKLEEKAGIANPSREGVKIEEQKEFYLSFAEVEVETDNIFTFIMLLFKYMPAHVEIISPEHISIPNSGMNEILNNLVSKLHGYDEIARVLQVQKAILEDKLKHLENPASKKAEKSGKSKKNIQKKKKK